jgi:ribosomal protein L7/L12
MSKWRSHSKADHSVHKIAKGREMAFGRKNENSDDSVKADEKALRDKLRLEAKEKKSLEREEKTQQRIAEKNTREEERRAREKRDLELYGRLVIEEVCAGKCVRIYDKGFVRVSGLFSKDGAVFEKLIAISSSADVAKKTALGRTLMAGATMGVNLLTTPNKRGDMYLTITTSRDTHMLHMSPPTEREMKAMHKVSTAGQGVLDALARQGAASDQPNQLIQPSPPNQSVHKNSVLDELTKLVALRDAGALTDGEFASMKSRIMAEESDHGSVVPTEDKVQILTDDVVVETREAYEVELLDARGCLIEAIGVVRRFSDLKLGEAKKIVDSAPSIVGRNLNHDQASEFVNELRKVGAVAELR